MPQNIIQTYGLEQAEHRHMSLEPGPDSGKCKREKAKENDTFSHIDSHRQPASPLSHLLRSASHLVELRGGSLARDSDSRRDLICSILFFSVGLEHECAHGLEHGAQMLKTDLLPFAVDRQTYFS